MPIIDKIDYKPSWELTEDEKKRVNQYQISTVKQTNVLNKSKGSHEEELE